MDKIYHQRMAVDLHYPLHSRSLLDSQTATFPAKGRKNQDPQWGTICLEDRAQVVKILDSISC